MTGARVRLHAIVLDRTPSCGSLSLSLIPVQKDGRQRRWIFTLCDQGPWLELSQLPSVRNDDKESIKAQLLKRKDPIYDASSLILKIFTMPHLFKYNYQFFGGWKDAYCPTGQFLYRPDSKAYVLDLLLQNYTATAISVFIQSSSSCFVQFHR